MTIEQNNPRLIVELGAKWRLYTSHLPTGAQALGTVARGQRGHVGALVKLSDGRYAQVNAAAVRPLDGRKVAAALGTSGRPSKMEGGKRVQVYLDTITLQAAAKLGAGNVSEGIRQALKCMEESQLST